MCAHTFALIIKQYNDSSSENLPDKARAISRKTVAKPKAPLGVRRAAERIIRTCLTSLAAMMTPSVVRAARLGKKISESKAKVSVSVGQPKMQ